MLHYNYKGDDLSMVKQEGRVIQATRSLPTQSLSPDVNKFPLIPWSDAPGYDGAH
jgi:hypothetical protein